MSIRMLFVVGAGASKEAGLPTGEELKAKIQAALNIRFDAGSQLSGDSRIYRVLKGVSTKDAGPKARERLLHAAWQVSAGMTQALSIDNYIDSHRGNADVALVGKLAIATTILEAEKESFLNFQPQHPFPLARLAQTWYAALIQRLTERCTFEELPARLRTIVLVVFNYDRCIEHVLPYALSAYYGVSVKAMEAIMPNLQILHPYGAVGQLSSTGHQHVQFGQQIEGDQLLAVAQHLKTFTEGVDPANSDISEIRRLVEEADRVTFLGFGFLSLNMLLLFKGRRTRPSSYVIGTCYGMSADDQSHVKRTLSHYMCVDEQSVLLNNGTCAALFADFSRRLNLWFIPIPAP